MRKGVVALCLLLVSCVFPLGPSELIAKNSEEIQLPTITITAQRQEYFPSINNPCRFDYSQQSAQVELLGKLDCLREWAS